MNDYTATYSPEDNKLRLYAGGKLPAETYAEAKAHGFRWAPRQELFVTPMWTPDREDFLLDLAGEIDDEDKSLVERSEERAERFEDYSENRKDDAERAHVAVSAIADGIPMGQPILVGHHSERHARRDAKKIENGMRRAVKMWEQSEYWTQRAAGAIRHAKYKELPAVRSRRIKGIEADKRKQERGKADAEKALRIWTSGLTLEQARMVSGRSECGYLPVIQRDNGSSWSAYDVLQSDEERYQACPSVSLEEVIEVAKKVYPRRIVRYERWIDHYENRLAYERAMLGESGGIVTDRKGPEKGGAVRCWASHRGGWSYIVKVNRVSVSVLDNWGNSSDTDGSRNFKRTIPFDKLSAVMTATEVQQARHEGRLTEYGDKTGFMVSDASVPVPTRKPFIPYCPNCNAEFDPQKAESHLDIEGKTYSCTGKQSFNAMKETLKAGVQVVSAPQLFPTPRELAERMIEEADIQPGDRVLEPSAGTGMLLGAMGGKMFDEPGEPYLERDQLYAVEINSKLAERLEVEYPLTKVVCGDFLEQNGNLGTFDRIVMNPPFVNGADIQHIQHARTLLKDGGRLVALCANGPRQRAALEPMADYWEDLPEGSFSAQGTNVNVALLVINA